MKEDEMAEALKLTGDKRNTHEMIVLKPEGKTT
jgi:hypothetical protein